ncbi:MAG TPA: class IV adenylate cyclase [Lacipirellulaceae bacterium]|nr:class IV adenylate cyclase [Lacipirellulaceae bacterium]
MQYEVEQKHRVSNLDVLISKLKERNASFDDPIEQSDRYFAHPCRDFAKTDEAIRIRTVGSRSFVTYKGPKLDATTKTRRELELPLDPEDHYGARFAELLAALGFQPVAIVRKHRRAFRIIADSQGVEGALDDVAGLGCFVELELLADDTTLDAARHVITQLASELDLGPSERRSYLEMLLAKGLAEPH